MPQAGSFGGALDQPGNIGEDGLAIAALDLPSTGESVVNG